MDYIPTRRLVGNQMYTLAAIMAHNLNHELQMMAHPMTRGTLEKRSTKWIFEEARTIRHLLIQRAGRLTNNQGNLVLTLNANAKVEKQITHFLTCLGCQDLLK